MSLLVDSCWRAAAYCLHPRVIVLSLVPLAIMVGVGVGLGYFFWSPVVASTTALLQASAAFAIATGWLVHLGVQDPASAVALLLVGLALSAFVTALALLLVAWLMTPAMRHLVAQRRFPELQRRGRGSLAGALLWSLGQTALAAVALVVSMPLWLVPPLFLVVPPLIWGWLTYRVMSYDALDAHASAEERRAIWRQHRGPLLLMGAICGYLGMVPLLILAPVAMFTVFFGVTLPLVVWLYTLVFAFCGLWFSHYGLAALDELRQRAPVEPGFEPPARLAAPPGAITHDP